MIASSWEKQPVDSNPDFIIRKPLVGSTNPSVGRCNKNNVELVVKPINANIPNYLNAHEKIVSDLARDLGLPVAPFQLWKCENTSLPGEACKGASLVCAESLSHCLMDQFAIKAAIRSGCDIRYIYGGMAAFEEWINAEDRWERHLVFADGIIYFIDYGWSLNQNYSYKGSFFHQDSNAELIANERFKEGLIEVKNRIKALDEKRIHIIVNRIPAEFLPNNEKQYIIRRLVARKD